MGAVSVSRSSPPSKGWQGSSGASRSEEGIKSSLPRGPAALLFCSACWPPAVGPTHGWPALPTGAEGHSPPPPKPGTDHWGGEGSCSQLRLQRALRSASSGPGLGA